MSQKRINNYLDTVVAEDNNDSRYATTPKGVYRGLDLGVDASADLTIAEGYGVQHNGIVWYEDVARTISFTPPGAATDYTIVASHTDVMLSGGAEVTYAIQNGITPDSAVADGVVLGWIFHPGGGLPLITDYLLSAPKRINYVDIVSTSLPLEITAPLPRTYSDVAGAGANIVFTGQTATDINFDVVNYVVYQSVLRPAAGPPGAETLVQHIQYYMGSYRPLYFQLYVNVSGSGALALQLRDTALNIVALTGSPITNTGGWTTSTITVDRTAGTFTAGQPYTLRLTYSVDLGDEIQLARINAIYWPFPT
jgi:hypothetical protein